MGTGLQRGEGGLRAAPLKLVCGPVASVPHQCQFYEFEVGNDGE